MNQQQNEWKQRLLTYAAKTTTEMRNQECIICLETMPTDVESQSTIIVLPCKCANSAYHSACIILLLMSGENKNFCPHCKRKYSVSNNRNGADGAVFTDANVNADAVNGADADNGAAVADADAVRLRKLSYVFLVHIFTNSIMNLVNISMLQDYNERNANILSKLLLIFYFCKLLLNCAFIFAMERNANKYEKQLSISYIIQSILFILLVSLISTNKINFSATIILINNLVFSLSDLIFRIGVECHNRN